MFAIFLTVAWCSLQRAKADEENSDHQQKPPPYMLMLTIHTPGQQPDHHRNIPMKNLDECWDSAKEFMNESIPKGMIGISAACGKSFTAEDQDTPS